MSFTTRISMLSAIKRGDELRWEDFYKTYKSLIYFVGRDLGLNDTEKEDLVQDVMSYFFKKSETFIYDREKGKFRSYFKRIIKNKAIDIIRGRKNGTISAQTVQDIIENIPAKLDMNWDAQWKKHIFKEAVKEVQNQVTPQVFKVFSLVALKKMSVEDVSVSLGISKNAVYVYKNGAVSKLRSIVKELDD